MNVPGERVGWLLLAEIICGNFIQWEYDNKMKLSYSGGGGFSRVDFALRAGTKVVLLLVVVTITRD